MEPILRPPVNPRWSYGCLQLTLLKTGAIIWQYIAFKVLFSQLKPCQKYCFYICYYSNFFCLKCFLNIDFRSSRVKVKGLDSLRVFFLNHPVFNVKRPKLSENKKNWTHSLGSKFVSKKIRNWSRSSPYSEFPTLI